MSDLNFASFNEIDWTLLGAILLSGLIGLFVGLIREIVTLLVWVGSVLATLLLGPYILPYTIEIVQSNIPAMILAYAVAFIISLTLCWLFGYMISSALLKRGDPSNPGLGGIDRFLGFFYGVARGGIVICLLYFLSLNFLQEISDIGMIRNSKILPICHDFTRALYKAVPATLRTADIEEIHKKLNMEFDDLFQPTDSFSPNATQTTPLFDPPARLPSVIIPGGESESKK